MQNQESRRRWTDTPLNDSVSLKEFITDKFQTLEKNTDTARQSMEKRLEGMNEFRQQLKDQNATFITKEDYDSKQQILNTKIEALEKIVYIGLGLCLALEIALKVIIK